MRMRRTIGEGILDSGLQLGGAETFEQSEQALRDRSKIAAALRRTEEQVFTGRYRVGEAIGTTMLACLPFNRDFLPTGRL
jgi:hypothetical protein